MSATIVRRCVFSTLAPKPGGVYSQAVVVGRDVYLSGQIGLDPKTGEMVTGGVSGEAEQIMKNLKAVIEEAGGTLNNIVKTTILLKNIEDFASVNSVYGKYFQKNPPARAAYAAANLPKNALVEIEAIAVLGDIKDES